MFTKKLSSILSLVLAAAVLTTVGCAKKPKINLAGLQQSPAENGDPGTPAVSATARYICRSCGAEYNSLTAFCPNCGGNGTLEERSEQ